MAVRKTAIVILLLAVCPLLFREPMLYAHLGGNLGMAHMLPVDLQLNRLPGLGEYLNEWSLNFGFPAFAIGPGLYLIYSPFKKTENQSIGLVAHPGLLVLVGAGDPNEPLQLPERTRKFYPAAVANLAAYITYNSGVFSSQEASASHGLSVGLGAMKSYHLHLGGIDSWSVPRYKLAPQPVWMPALQCSCRFWSDLGHANTTNLVGFSPAFPLLNRTYPMHVLKFSLYAFPKF